MASPTYTCQGLVLRKTKLSETDLIITLLADDGSQKRMVAKGARKPSSTFSSRLELFSVVDVLCAVGKSLDIVKEVRLIESNQEIRSKIELTYAASPIAEMLAKVSQPELPNEKLYASSVVAMRALNTSAEALAPAICAAQLMKILAFDGLRPALSNCVLCGGEEGLCGTTTLEGSPSRMLSYQEGGLVCQSCAFGTDAIPVSDASVQWADFLLRSPFADISEYPIEPSASFSVLRLCQGFIHAHVGSRLKSLDMLFTCGLF